MTVYISIGLAIMLIVAVIGLIIYGTAMTVLLFGMDSLLVFIASVYGSHHYLSPLFSSGKAQRFWDVVIALAAVALYAYLFRLVYKKWPVAGKIWNFLFSLFGSAELYFLVVSWFVKEKPHLIPLLDNAVANKVVNYIFILILAVFVFFVREGRIAVELASKSEDPSDFGQS